MRVDDLGQIAITSGDDVIALHRTDDRFIIETVFANGVGINVIVHDLAVRVLRMLGIGEVEIAAVVAESVIFCIDVLPRPVLCGQFAVHRVLGGDVLALVVVEHIRQSLFLSPHAHLHGLDYQRSSGNVHILVCSDEHPNRLSGVSDSPTTRILEALDLNFGFAFHSRQTIGCRPPLDRDICDQLLTQSQILLVIACQRCAQVPRCVISIITNESV